MPIVKHIMQNLVKEYGPKKGKNVYYAMEQKGMLAKALRTELKKKHASS